MYQVKTNINSNINASNVLDNISVDHDYSGMIKINSLGKIEVLNKDILGDIKNDQYSNLDAKQLQQEYVNFSCNGNSSCS